MMKTTKILLWIAYLSFALSILFTGFLGIFLLKNDVGAQGLDKENLNGVFSESTTFTYELPMNLSIEYYFRIEKEEVAVNNYFLKLQKKFIKNSKDYLNKNDNPTYPRNISGNLYSMPESESYVYVSIPYSIIQTTISIYNIYSFLVLGILLLAIFLAIKFLENCNKGLFFITENTNYIRLISYLALSYSLASLSIQWIISNVFYSKIDQLPSMEINSSIDFNWSFFIFSISLVLIAQAFTEGAKLKEEQSLTI